MAPTGPFQENRPLWWRPTGYAVVIATLLGVVETGKALVVAPSVDPDFGLARAAATNMSWWYLWAALVPVIVRISERIPLDGVRFRVVLAHGASSVILSLVHVGAASGIIWLASSRRFLSLGTQVERLVVSYGMSNLVTYWAIAAAYSVWAAHRRLRMSETEKHALELEAAHFEALMTEARLEMLRRELNPHFLFNALNGVSALARRGESDAAVLTLSRLGELLRRTLDEEREPEVTVSEELELLELYLDIERIRFGDRLMVDVDVDPSVRGALLPPFVLQPLAENAIHHGIASLRGPGGISVRVGRCAGRLELRVRDTGVGLRVPPRELEEGVGLRNTRRRLETLYGAEAGLEIRPGRGGGTEVRVQLPLRLEPVRVRR